MLSIRIFYKIKLFNVDLFLYRNIILMEGRLTTLHFVECIVLAGLYWSCLYAWVFMTCLCIQNVWHILIGSDLIQAALGKWCCLSSFTTPGTWLLGSGASTWFPCLSLTIWEGFFDWELCEDERIDKAWNHTIKHTIYSFLNLP